MRDLLGVTLKELEVIVQEWGYPPFHAQQIFSWLYQKGVTEFSQMSDLSQELRRRLKENFSLSSFTLMTQVRSKDGTEKFLFKLQDGNCIEAVIIPADERITGCISTQAGCKFACSFCASGLLGFKRNLTAGEIIEQVMQLERATHNLTHLVFMGIGEPLDNYDNVMKAIRIINAKEALHIGARRITISTAGLIPGIKKLAEEGLQIELSVSLHAADDKTRSRLMPINKKYPLRELMKACRDYIQKTNRQITFEYILIKGVNSDLQNAVFLSKMIGGMNAKVNLIPANAGKGGALKPPEKLETLFFQDYLLKHGLHVTLRKPRGQDIEAACGQLRLRYERE